MSFKEVTEHRKAGRLDEALKIALQDYEEAQTSLKLDVESQQGDKKPEEIPANLIWPKRALAWVYYEYLKKHCQPTSFDAFKENLIKINELQMPEDEKMFYDNCAWQIGSMVFALQKNDPIDYVKVNALFEIIKDFYFTKPSEAYSFLYKAFHKVYQNWSKYLDFADWWDFENFQPENFLREEYKGKKIMAIVEQAYIAYSKKLLEGEPLDSFGQQRALDKEKIHSFLPLIDKIIEKHPEYQYPPYFKAKLLLATGKEENVLSAFLPFARQKKNDFWVWELMAEIFADNEKLKFACYCKALSLRTSEEFLVKLRESFAKLLVDRQMYSEAKTEIEKVINTREKQGWKVSKEITNWLEKDWFKTAESKPDNKLLYAKNAKDAEEILYQEIPEEVIAVEFVNINKKILSFVQSQDKHGFFKYAGLIEKPRIGDVLKVRFSDFEQDGYCKALTVNEADQDTVCPAIKDFSGEVKIITPQNIAFVGDVFLESKLVISNSLKDKQSVIGKAILSYNKKKNEWGWKALAVS